jgi:hypothetical protein
MLDAALILVTSLRPHRRCLDRHPARALHEEKFQGDEFIRAEGIEFGAQAEEAVAQPALQRPEALPFQAVDRVTVWMTLRQQRAGDPPAPVVVMALRAAQIDLTLPPRKQLAPAVDERLEPLVACFRDRRATRLASNVDSERQQVVTFEWQRRRPLMLGAFEHAVAVVIRKRERLLVEFCEPNFYLPIESYESIAKKQS